MFDFILKHHPGSSSTKPDLLSRHSDHDQGESDNENTVLLKPNFFENEATSNFFRIQAIQQGHVMINAEEAPILSAIRETKEYDESVVKAVQELKQLPTKGLKSDEW